MKTITSFIFLLAVLICASCGKNEGACEFKAKKSAGSGYNYYCFEGETESSCNDFGGSAEKAFHKGKSCADIGYTYHQGTTTYHADDSTGTTPGAGGAFTGGGSGGSVDCSGGYQGPEFDIQIDSQCKTAYAYACAGNQEGVDACCAIYNTYRANDPTMPACPYCD